MSRRREGGFALPAVLLAVLLLSIALALVAASLQLRMQLVRRETQALTLTALSDAALAETLAWLAQNAFYQGVPDHAFGNGRYRSDVRRLGPGRYEVIATATYAGRRRTVAAEVIRPAGSPMEVVRWQRR